MKLAVNVKHVQSLQYTTKKKESVWGITILDYVLLLCQYTTKKNVHVKRAQKVKSLTGSLVNVKIKIMIDN